MRQPVSSRLRLLSCDDVTGLFHAEGIAVGEHGERAIR